MGSRGCLRHTLGEAAGIGVPRVRICFPDCRLRNGFGLSRSGGAIVVNRWDEKAGLRRDAVPSQVIDVLEVQEIKETGNEES